MSMSVAFNPEFDLKLERVVDVPRSLVWKAWTEPEHLKAWFCPRPWQTVECEIDLRVAGKFSTVMRSPDGKDYPNEGCYLEIVPEERLVWTDALVAGFRPSAKGYLTDDAGFYLTAALTLESVGSDKTRYTAYALHRDATSRKKHEAMGFANGWVTALDQLVDHMTRR
jgi:uncharacterized protein YndB with AHSA1/START domain